MLLDPECPPDAIRYYREQGNEEVGKGIKRSFMQEMEESDDIEKAWLVECERKRVEKKALKDRAKLAKHDKSLDSLDLDPASKKRDQSGKESLQKDFIFSNWPGYFDSNFEGYVRSRRVRKTLVERGLYSYIRDWVMAKGRLFEPTLNNNEVVLLWDKILTSFGGKNAGDAEIFRTTSDGALSGYHNSRDESVLALMKLCVPNLQEEVYPWIMRKSSEFALAQRLHQSLEGSEVMNASRKAHRDMVLASGLEQSNGNSNSPSIPSTPGKKLVRGKPKVGSPSKIDFVVEIKDSADDAARTRAPTVHEDLITQVGIICADLEEHTYDRPAVVSAFAAVFAMVLREKFTTKLMSMDGEPVTLDGYSPARHHSFCSPRSFNSLISLCFILNYRRVTPLGFSSTSATSPLSQT